MPALTRKLLTRNLYLQASCTNDLPRDQVRRRVRCNWTGKRSPGPSDAALDIFAPREPGPIDGDQDIDNMLKDLDL